MIDVNEIIKLLKEQWHEPHKAVQRGKECPFLLSCIFSSQPAISLGNFPLSIPEDIRVFWQTARNAELFKDVDFGQWGVAILEPSLALVEISRQAAARPKEFLPTDLIIGRFFGDSDLVVINCNPNDSNFGSVTIALPIDKRNDWPLVAKSFGEFLKQLLDAQGDKYWEP